MMPVIDVFAGPGGLNEGFSALERDGKPFFDVVASFEMEANAVETLVLRDTVRRLGLGDTLHAGYRAMLAGRRTQAQFRDASDVRLAEQEARSHVHPLELGPGNRDAAAERIRQALAGKEEFVLIGGPPCQAYSLVGRSRRAHDPTFDDDHKHFLYREYLDILKRFRPTAFVMENVKGLLSAGHRGTRMFDRIMEDLRQGDQYEIRSFVVPDADPAPRDFVIRSEDFGIPQRRHRVILLGVRKGISLAGLAPLEPTTTTTVRQAIGDLSIARVRVTRDPRPKQALAAAEALGKTLAGIDGRGVPKAIPGSDSAPALRQWLRRSDVVPSLHEARGHMELDLARYRYLAEMAERGLFPRVHELPVQLKPRHKNVDREDTPFVDRFKVQQWDKPSSTIASHIAKDGHYYIHPDPKQMRSLTVREAARLQTFPDDYFFCGPRTAQYHQVGNAVPPLLAHLIAGKVADILGG